MATEMTTMILNDAENDGNYVDKHKIVKTAAGIMLTNCHSDENGD